jgi:hypothetical protein
LSYHERWTVAFANILFEKSILTPEQLARKMVEVAARYRQSPTTRRWRSTDDEEKPSSGTLIMFGALGAVLMILPAGNDRQ